MHRLVSLSGDDPTEEVSFVEQPSAPILYLTSAISDIATLTTVLSDVEHKAKWDGIIRAQPLNLLSHPAVIDHYLSTTAATAQIVIIRLLGGRGHWHYGIEQFLKWQKIRTGFRKHLLILAGTQDQDNMLNELSSVDINIANKAASLLREGG